MLLGFRCSNSKWYSGVFMATLGRDPNKTTDGVLGELLPDLDQGSTELLDILRSNLAASDGPKHKVPELLYWIWIRQTWRTVRKCMHTFTVWSQPQLCIRGNPGSTAPLRPTVSS